MGNDIERNIDACRKFLANWPNERRHPLIAENTDWETISPALLSCGALIEYARNSPTALYHAYGTMRCIVEAAYCIGHERGKASRPALEFIVTEEVLCES